MNIFDRAFEMVTQCMQCVYGELFTPIETDRTEIVSRMKNAMLSRNSIVTLTGTETEKVFTDDLVEVYEDMLNTVAKQMGELV